MPHSEALTPLVALTGAGVSAESGVPTFRGEGGLWESYRAEDLATPDAFERDPELVWRFYSWRRQLVHDCQPNSAHILLAEIEDQVGDFTLLTQNIDGLHQEAGSRAVVELHGSLWRLKCTRCAEKWTDRTVPLEKAIPKCPECGGLARPNVVWFKEALEKRILRKAYEAVTKANTLLVIGTSAVVEPAASMPRLAKHEGATVVEFNLEQTPVTSIADQVYRGAASAQLAAWWDTVKT